MAKINETVRRETKYIALWVVIFSALMQAVFLVIGQWFFPVLWGNLLGGAAAVVNFLLLGLTVQKAVGQSEKQAAATMRVSQSARFLFLGLIGLLGAVLSVFNIWTTLIPLLFPRLAIALRPLFGFTVETPLGAVVPPADDEDEDDED